ncbi:MAG: STT3 domain-containing protein [Candidatus Omnitrophota bacterium]|nr:STT3 domain-containing protein [Candidatus Omnitrophota bacterium]
MNKLFTRKSVILLLSFCLAMGLNLYYRSFSINFPHLKKQAKIAVEGSFRKAVSEDVQKRFPQFYYLAKEEISKTRFSQGEKQNRKEINKRTQDLYATLKSRFQDDANQTYLMELDCWHWARYVDNVVKFGHPGDEVIDGRQWDALMIAPIGSFMTWTQFLFYLSGYLYKLFSIFKVVPLFTFLFYLPLLFASIFIAVLFFFSFRYSGKIGAVTSALFVGLAPCFVPRSCAGWFDTDILNMLFPLLIVWTYLSYREAVSFKKRMAWISLTSFIIGLYCFTWPYWWFILAIILVYEAISLIYTAFSYFYLKKNYPDLVKRRVIPLVSLFALSFCFAFLIAGRIPLEVLYIQIIKATALGKPLLPSIWPNVFFTVGELQKAHFKEIVRSIGGIWIFWPAVLCMVSLFIRAIFYKKYAALKRAPIIIFAIWFVVMFIASTRGVRFVVFLLIPLGISLGWVLNDAYKYFRNKKNMFGIILIAALFLGENSLIVNRGYASAQSIFSLMDDTWYKVLTLIEEKTPPETILNSWWDFGDWFKAVANRRVIFDGQSQDVPQAYWMAKAILSRDEEEAIGILRMLNNGGNRAFEIMNNYIKDQLTTVLLLESLIPSKPEMAQQVLLKYLPPLATEKVMEMLFYNPPKAGFIVDYTMISKVGAISYLGNWDFSKVYIAQNFNSREKDKILSRLKSLMGSKLDRDIDRFYQEAFLISNRNSDEWLSRRLQFYSDVINGREKDGMVLFENGFIYNIKEQTIQSNLGQIPGSIFVLAGNDVVEKPCQGANLPFSVLVYKVENEYKCIFLDRELGKSMFVRLYFLKGEGLRHFSSYIDAEEGNNRIRFLNIRW